MAGFEKIRKLFSSDGIRKAQKKKDPFERPPASDREQRYRDAFERAEKMKKKRKWDPEKEEWVEY